MDVLRKKFMEYNYTLKKSTDYYINKLRVAVYSEHNDMGSCVDNLNKREITGEVDETSFKIRIKVGNHLVRRELLNPIVYGKFISSKTSNKLFIKMHCPYVIPFFLIFFVVCIVFSFIILYESKDNPVLVYYAFPLPLVILLIIYLLLGLLLYFNCRVVRKKIEAILFK